MVGADIKHFGKVRSRITKIKSGKALVALADSDQIPLKKVELHIHP
jgi:hypothetical protein